MADFEAVSKTTVGLSTTFLRMSVVGEKLLIDCHYRNTKSYQLIRPPVFFYCDKDDIDLMIEYLSYVKGQIK